jgi:lipid-binding SYLF domain-containing protein
MFKRLLSFIGLVSFLALAAPAYADPYADTIKVFQNAGESGKFFKTAYGYAVFPTIGKAGFVVGGAYGEGRVYARGKHIGNTSMTQASIGFQLGAEGFSQIVFFENEAALKEFTKGNFEFGADAQAVAIVLAAGAKANTAGSGASASATKNAADTASAGYRKGMATFTVVKGGLMYEASVSGQKFTYKPVK